MLALYIIAAIILLLALLLFAKIKIVIEYNEKKLFIRLKYLFLTFTIIPQKEKSKEKQKTDEKDEKSKSEKKQKTDYLQQYERIKDKVKPALEILKKFNEHLVISPFRLKLVMVGEDASELAIQYGALCSVFYPAFAFLKTQFSIKNEQIDISVDYVGKETIFTAYTIIGFRTWFVLTSGISVLKLLLKYIRTQQKEGNVDNE